MADNPDAPAPVLDPGYTVLQALELCGFTAVAERIAIRNQAIPTFESFRRMDESDITTIAT
jgi:hypothetical protein